MNIGFISDLHIDTNKQYVPDILNTFTKVCKQLNLDLVVIAGDISSSAADTIKFVNKVNQRNDLKVFFVPGNHDIYSKKDSFAKYKLLSDSQFCIVDKPIFVGEQYAILGDLGWYDYTLSPLSLSNEQFEQKTYGGIYTSDKTYINVGMTDPDFTQYFLDKIEKQLQGVQNKKTIFVSHMLPFKELVILKSDNCWNYFSGFMGSSKIGELLKKYNVELSICGHTHIRQHWITSSVEMFSCPLGLPYEWEVENDFEKSLLESFVVKNIL